MAGIKDLLNLHVVIEKDSVRIKKLGSKIVVNTEFASRGEFWDVALFLPENIVDWRYFIRIAYFEKMKDGNLVNIDFSLTPEQGAGGGRVIDTYKIRCREEKFILAILDSDCCYPGQPYIPNSVADQFSKLSPSNYLTGRSIILDVHEIENLFSSNIFLSNGNRSKAEKFISYNLSSDVRQFYDFKVGFAYNRIYKNSYMNKKLTESGIAIKVCSNFFECLKKNKNCSCVIFEGMGKDFLTDLFGSNITESKKDILISIKSDLNGRLKDAPEGLIDPIKNEWKKIYEAFLTWFCSFKQEVYVS